MSIEDHLPDFELEDEEDQSQGTCCGNKLNICELSCKACTAFRKALTFIVSHVGLIMLVAGYCLIGAFTFERLERDHEQSIKKSIAGLRANFTDDVWRITNEQSYLRFENWSDSVHRRMKEFEHSILSSMKVDGWNGYEDPDKKEWTFAGALFYSIVVVTTIGYGDQTPKTDFGKLATVIFAILGIPLMLFCLSNTGDAMASSFRFFYWKVCCILCVNGNNRSLRARRINTTLYQQQRVARPLRRRATTLSRSSRRSDTPKLTRSHSVRVPKKLRRIATEDLSLQINQEEILDPSSNIEQNEIPSPSSDISRNNSDTKSGGQKVEKSDSKRSQKSLKPAEIRKTPSSDSNLSNVGSPTSSKNLFGPTLSPTATSSSPFFYPSSRLPIQTGNFRAGKSNTDYDYVICGGQGTEFVVTPTDEEDNFDFEKRSIPLWVCMFWVLSYVAGGAVLFSGWEGWTLLDSSYFCFITLTTIGFGDYVPKTNKRVNAEVSILFCSLYLLFGMSLLVMTFNLVQDEVIFKVRTVAHKLGIINDEEMYDIHEN